MGSGASSAARSDVKELQQIFDACDLESCGFLTGEDLKIALAGVGLEADAAKRVDFPAFCELVKQATVADQTRIVPFALRGMRFEQLQAICAVCGCGQDGWLLAQCQSAMESESGTRHLKEDLYSLNRFLVRPATAGPEDVWVSNPSCGECRLLHVYAHLGDLPNLDFLLAARADPMERAKDPKHRAALHFAVKAGHDDCAKRLLEGKALAHDPDRNGETPLQIAAYGGFTSLAQLLLCSRAVVNAADRDGWTALICAARAGHGEVVELLLLNKASPHAMDCLGRNAFRHAKMAGYDLPQLEVCSEMLEEDLECQMVDR